MTRESAQTRLAAFTAGSVWRVNEADRSANVAVLSPITFAPDVEVVLEATGTIFGDAPIRAPVLWAHRNCTLDQCSQNSIKRQPANSLP